MFPSKVTTCPVINNYECPKQLLIVEKHQFIQTYSLHLHIKQNGTCNVLRLECWTENLKINKWEWGMCNYQLQLESISSTPIPWIIIVVGNCLVLSPACLVIYNNDAVPVIYWSVSKQDVLLREENLENRQTFINIKNL